MIVVFKPLETCHLQLMTKRDIHALSIPYKMSNYHFLLLMRTLVNLECLDISHNVELCTNSVNLALLYGERKYMNMSILNTSYCRLLNDNTYLSLFRRMSNLTEVNLSGCTLITDDLLHFVSASIKGLYITSCWQTTDYGFPAIRYALPLPEERRRPGRDHDGWCDRSCEEL